jgi:hypothetical protein
MSYQPTEIEKKALWLHVELKKWREGDATNWRGVCSAHDDLEAAIADTGKQITEDEEIDARILEITTTTRREN